MEQQQWRWISPGSALEGIFRRTAASGRHPRLRQYERFELLTHTRLQIDEALSRDVTHLAHDRGLQILRQSAGTAAR